ncbi:MAG: hypothetical protein LBU61_06450 [Coriobacteriales bacterium]|jgi:hypothetical protein|nr:hypothetical protein [Coriobacteriales bacterium]
MTMNKQGKQSRIKLAVSLSLAIALMLTQLMGCIDTGKTTSGGNWSGGNSNNASSTRNNEPVLPDVDEFPFEQYFGTLWFCEYAWQSYQDCVSITGMEANQLYFKLTEPGGVFPYQIDCRTTVVEEKTSNSLTLGFEIVPNGMYSSDAKIRGSLQLSTDGKSMVVIIHETSGLNSVINGYFNLANGFNEPAVQRFIYKNVLTEYVGYDSNPVYYLYDINKDGVPELIIKEGSNEAESTFVILSVQRSGLEFFGSLSAGHCGLYHSDYGGICRLFAQMGHEEIYQLSIINNQIFEELIFSQIYLESDPDYYYFPSGGILAWASVRDNWLLDSIVGAAAIREFFALYAAGDYQQMQYLACENLSGVDFSKGVYGMASADLTACDLWYEPGETGAGPSVMLFLCSFDMKPTAGSVYSPNETEASFFIAVKEDMGRFKLAWFSTGP